MAAGYTGISISVDAREALRLFQAQATGVLARRMTMSDALRLAVQVASDHPDRLPAAWETLSETENGEK